MPFSPFSSSSRSLKFRGTVGHVSQHYIVCHESLPLAITNTIEDLVVEESQEPCPLAVDLQRDLTKTTQPPVPYPLLHRHFFLKKIDHPQLTLREYSLFLPLI